MQSHIDRDKYQYANFPCRVIATIILIFFVCITVIPLFYNDGSINNLDGTVGKIDNYQIWSKLDPLSEVLCSFCDLCCHQIKSRSFEICGSQMILCIRDYMIVVGVIVGLILVDGKNHFFRFKIKHRVIIGLILILIMVAEWSIEKFLNVDLPVLRATTSLFFGIGCAMMLSVIVIMEVQFLYKIKDKRNKRD